MNARKGLFWSEKGEVCCARHAPFVGSDTWQHDGWRKISATDRAAAIEEVGCCAAEAFFVCEVCGHKC